MTIIDLSRYDAILLDLWGVVHDGTALYPDALASMKALHEAGKKIVLLSNAPRRASKAREVLDKLGVERSLYDLLLTSGEAAYEELKADPDWLGTYYYYLGPGKDEDILRGLQGYTRVDEPEDADFVLNTGFEVDFQPKDEVKPTLERLRENDLPLLCVNPDFEVVKLDGTHMLCAGVVAQMYDELGGIGFRIGKPYPLVYKKALSFLGLEPSRVLAIGDGPATDILGANHAGIDSLLITGGILSVVAPGLDEARARAICEEQGARPTYILPSFRLSV